MEQLEFKKGDFVTGTWGVEKRVFRIVLKPKMLMVSEESV